MNDAFSHHHLALATSWLVCIAACGDDGAVQPTVDVAQEVVDGVTDSAEGDAGADVSPAPCPWPVGGPETLVWNDPSATATLEIDEPTACHRRYHLSTTADLRDGEPGNPRTFAEADGWPTLRSGHSLFDALYALALDEVREASVDAIRDGSFSNGAAIACEPPGCFETGRLWRYVWTRDISYAVDLGLGDLDAARAATSLRFKLAAARDTPSPLEVVQDTGSGGSYPVSTDRVTWSLGAARVLPLLEASRREPFEVAAREALAATVERDRQVAYDPNDGLYRGEQSFLDWREQTYPAWTASDVTDIAASKALGTNVAHLRALELASELAADMSQRDRYAAWASSLRTAIRDAFWLEDAGMFASVVSDGVHRRVVRRFDLLSSALAILHDVATPEQATRMVSGYPLIGPGAPVVWPQQQLTPIYHNRGEWPFVTAYWLRAAAQARHPVVATKMARALVRGAALNLSNMENFEAASGAAYVDEGVYSGPVVNSQRQLWSVAGYVSLVHHTLFGIRTSDAGLALQPYVPAPLAAELFTASDTLTLDTLSLRGNAFRLVLKLPSERSSGEAGAYVASVVRVDGVEISGDAAISWDALSAAAEVEVELVFESSSTVSVDQRDVSDWRAVFAPRTPSVTIDEQAVDVRLGLRTDEAAEVVWRVFRDGEIVADGLPGATTTWTDTAAVAGVSHCYSAEVTFSTSGNHSYLAKPVCRWGPGSERVDAISIDDPRLSTVGGQRATDHGRPHIGVWGDPGHTLTVEGYTATRTGPHWLQLVYGNGAGGVSSGITCGVKRLRVERVVDAEEVATGYLVMPQLGDWGRWADSTLVAASLVEGEVYRFVVDDGGAAGNMSRFDHFSTFTAGLGGEDGPFNRVNIAEVKVLVR